MSDRLQRLRDTIARAANLEPIWVPGVSDLAFVLAQLDAAEQALHDLREETGYDRGYADGAAAEKAACARLVDRIVNVFVATWVDPEAAERLRRRLADPDTLDWTAFEAVNLANQAAAPEADGLPQPVHFPPRLT